MRYFNVITAFNIHDALKKSKSPPHAGKNKVHKNIKTWNEFPYFFQVIEDATRYYYFIELAKFFDPDRQKRTVTLKMVVEDIEANLLTLTKENFFKYREQKGQPIEESFKYMYKPITTKDIAGWKKTLTSIRSLAKNIVDYRSQALAHDDVNKTFKPISRGELIKIFKTLDKLLNKLSSKIDWSSTSYRNAKESQIHTKLVIEYLGQHKQARIKELERKWKVRIGNNA